jgi:hypothetical protein
MMTANALSLPSWSCGFDSRHPLTCSCRSAAYPANWLDRLAPRVPHACHIEWHADPIFDPAVPTSGARGGVGKRDFGAVRRLPSGCWQARYRPLDGSLATAPATFPTRAQAAAFLAEVQADRSRGVWVDPRAGSIPFGEYAASWPAQRVDLRPRTVELYDGLLRRPLLPHFARMPLDRITPGEACRWHAARVATGLGPSTVAKAYRLLKTILSTAVADELLVRKSVPAPRRRLRAHS